MFLHYYVDTRARKGDVHEVHHEGCVDMPPLKYSHYLGMFESTVQAVHMAKVIYPDTAAGCRRCTKIRVKSAVRLHR